MGVVERLVSLRRYRFAREISMLIGPDVPREVVIGPGLILQHRAVGTVIHPDTIIENDVTIYHQVTIGRADAHIPRSESPMVNIVIRSGAILYPGSRILGSAGTTVVGRGTIVAANAVLTTSTGDREIWAGVPARKVGNR